jgi:hypothetical protein
LDAEDEMSDRPAADVPGSTEDVVALLVRQHGEIRNLFDEVEASTGEARVDAFRRLVRLLSIHETAEEEVVHPYARRAFDGGEGVVEDRLREERDAKERLSRLDRMDPSDPRFLPELLALRTAVMAHARAEERYEFIHLQRSTNAKQRATMAKALKAAEATAPTRPHPGVETGGRNLLFGPVAAVVDRARDMVRKVWGGG